MPMTQLEYQLMQRLIHELHRIADALEDVNRGEREKDSDKEDTPGKKK